MDLYLLVCHVNYLLTSTADFTPLGQSVLFTTYVPTGFRRRKYFTVQYLSPLKLSSVAAQIERLLLVQYLYCAVSLLKLSSIAAQIERLLLVQYYSTLLYCTVLITAQIE